MASLGGTALGAATRVLKTKKSDKTAADQPGGSNAKVADVDLAGAFSAEKLVGDTTTSVAEGADYYRYGSKGVNGTPARGMISFAHDETEASIRIIREDGNTDILPPYTKFILESVQEAHSERHQIVETFGEHYVFMYGERPPMYNFGGSLINSNNANWVNDFMLMYERYLRGTRCTEQKTRALITYGGRQVEGYILNTSNQTAASSQEAVNFSFQLLVTSRKILGVSSDFGEGLAATEGSSSLVPLLAQIGVPGVKGSSQPGASDANRNVKQIMAGSANPFGTHA